jgi:hypothetical protein
VRLPPIGSAAGIVTAIYGWWNWTSQAPNASPLRYWTLIDNYVSPREGKKSINRVVPCGV